MPKPAATDLSAQHQPVTLLFDTDDPEQYRLDDDRLTAFANQGYIQGVPLLNPKQIDVLRHELSAFVNPSHSGSELWYEYHSNESNDPDSVLFHALGAWRIGPACHDVLWSPRFTRPASQLLGGAVRFWHDQLFCKPARQGGVVAWHQDYSYWTRTGPMNHLTCWIALDDTTQENGCIQYIPGSHLWQLLPMAELAGEPDSIRDVLSAEQWEQLQQAVPMEMQAGEACFHHPLTLHGSSANRSERPRRALVINVVLDGTQSLSDEPLLAGTESIPAGQPLGGRFFPLLYDPEAAEPRDNGEAGHR